MKIGGTPPGGDNFRVPGPDGPKPGKTNGKKGARFGEKLDGATGGGGANDPAPVRGAGGPQTEKIRELLAGIDTDSPAAVEEAADRMVDWVLTERFGKDVLNMKGAGDLRKSVRDQLLGDPAGEARIRKILEGL